MANTPSVSPSQAMPDTSSSNGIIASVFQTMLVMLVLIVSILEQLIYRTATTSSLVIRITTILSSTQNTLNISDQPENHE
ncbi:hypothetical protein LguiA_014252 [Lonicera macranthoides]